MPKRKTCDNFVHLLSKSFAFIQGPRNEAKMISAPFELLVLPAIPGGHQPENVSLSGNEEGLTLGVSQSSITTLTLRPPQVLKAFSIPPGTLITAVNGDYYATKERNKFFLRSQAGGMVELSSRVQKIFICSDFIITVDSNAHIHAYKDFELKWSDISRQSEKYSYSGIIDNATLVIVSQHHENMVVRTILCEPTGSRELCCTEIAVKVDYISCCEENLYLASGNEVHLYKLPDARLESSFVLEGEINGCIAVPRNNVVISHSSGLIRLIDCTYESEISTCQLHAKILSYHDGAILALADGGILGLSVTPSNGTLLESLGRGLNKSTEWDLTFTDIFNSFQGPGRDTKKTAETQLLSARSEAQEVLADIQLALANRNGEGVARIVNYCKNPELPWSDSRAPGQQDLVYEDSDRQLDRELVKSIVFGIFGAPKLHFRNFIPLGVAIYFLTHPLFPTNEPEIDGLLHSLQSQPLLYRQAIVTMPGIYARELVAALLHPDPDIFNDAAQRLVEEFGESQIIRAFETAFGFVKSASQLSLLVERLSLSADGWPLVGPLISAVGLLAWDPELLQRLQRRFSVNISSVEAAIAAESALKDVLQGLNLDVDSLHTSSRRKKNQKHTRPNVSEKLPSYSIETLSLP